MVLFLQREWLDEELVRVDLAFARQCDSRAKKEEGAFWDARSAMDLIFLL